MIANRLQLQIVKQPLRKMIGIAFGKRPVKPARKTFHVLSACKKIYLITPSEPLRDRGFLNLAAFPTIAAAVIVYDQGNIIISLPYNNILEP